MLPNLLFWIFPQICTPAFPHLSSTMPKTCVGQLLCFHSKIPPVLLLEICHNMRIISYYPSPAQSPINSAPLSCCHFHLSLPLLLLPCSLRGFCFPLGSRNTEFKLTFLSQVPYFEPAHTLQIIAFSACGSDFFCLSSVSPEFLVFAPDISLSFFLCLSPL